MEVSVGLLLVLVEVVQGFQIQSPAGPLVAQLGGSVLLPCSVETPLPLEELEVEWRRTDSESLVHLFQEGEVRPESQDYTYRGRAHFFTVDMSKGNYSLLLKNVSREDAGIYSCKVYTENEAHKITVDLEGVEYLVVTGAGAVYASKGEAVVLNCSVDSHIPPEELIEVSWRRTDQGMLVLLYQHGEVLPDSSHERYRGRAEFFTTEIPKGNFSLRLKDVRTEDEGEYICEARSSNLIGKSTVKIDKLQMGLSFLHYLVLMCCAASFLISSVAVVHFMSRGRNVLAVHFLLVFSPNILLFSGFVLWGSAEGLFSEAAACSVVNLTRILFLLVTTPYLGAVHGSSQKLIRVVSVTVEHTVIAVVVYSDAYNKRLKWSSYIMDGPFHIRFIRLYVFFGLTIFFSLCAIYTEIVSVYQLPCMLPRSEPGPNSQMEPSKQVWTFTLLEISSIAQMLFLSLKTKRYTHDIRQILIWIAPLLPMIVILIRRLVRKRPQCWGPISPGEGAGLLCVFALLKMLANVSLSKHPDSIPEIPQTILFMFGAAGLSIVNSIGLATKLFLTSGGGHQNVPDLRFITLPSECVFVFGWFTLQIHDYWTHKHRTESNSERHRDLVLQDTADTHEMHVMARPDLHTSDPSLMTTVSEQKIYHL
ncbi:uncharacterized protein LOC105906484 isoform X2 [Clupea harengus]|uniref:Uncharacterized protein LOC105906484 isoform X2 n=1 Tax=Clupea harengus TaxID=7950 RepID=A0A8M1KNQ8_CLUHA|nr:uncharacterized protein LOC105906484 isoform X2 [Clupea harengus]